MKVKDVVTGTVITGVSVFYLISAQSIKIFKGSGATAINSKTIPSLWGFLLLFLGLLLSIKGLLAKDENNNKTKTTFPSLVENNREVLLTILLLCLYVLSLKALGFILASILYLFFQVLLLAKGSRKKVLPWAMVLAVLVSVGTYLLFVYLLDVRLPAGLLAF